MKVLFISFFLILSTIGFSQELEKIAENQMDEKIVVFTFKLKYYQKTTQSDSNLLGATTNKYANFFYNYNGVTHVLFDKATGLITIYANINTEIPNIIKPEELNNIIEL